MTTENKNIPKGQTISPEEAAWLAHAQAEQQKSPDRVEEAAKYLAGIIAISLTIFIDKRPNNLADWTTNWLTLAAILWMLATFLSLFVLFPFPYTYQQDNPDSIKAAFQKVARRKRAVLSIAVILFVIALTLAVGVFILGLE